jgi:hypothetical protein
MSAMTLTFATRLGPDEILAPLGSGGMGGLYSARDAKLERDVALRSWPAASHRLRSASPGSATLMR